MAITNIVIDPNPVGARLARESVGSGTTIFFIEEH
jgi:hypothetical protein